MSESLSGQSLSGQSLSGQGRRHRSVAYDLPGSVALAVAVGLAYFLAAQLSLGLLLKPDGVAVFWPAAGIASGVLIVLGPQARWPVAVGAMVATLVANLLGDRDIWAASAFALCNAAEALITAELIWRWLGPTISLDRLRQVLGLLSAATAGTAISGSAELLHTSCSTVRRYRCSSPGSIGSHLTPSASSLLHLS
jgi:integral membrane sensor domain MASE1